MEPKNRAIKGVNIGVTFVRLPETWLKINTNVALCLLDVVNCLLTDLPHQLDDRMSISCSQLVSAVLFIYRVLVELRLSSLPTPFHSGGTAASRTSKVPTTAQPTRTRRRHLRARSCTVTAAFLWTAKVCRSSRARLRHRQVTRYLHLNKSHSLLNKKYNSPHLSNYRT